jgi:hypothetical protein
MSCSICLKRGHNARTCKPTPEMVLAQLEAEGVVDATIRPSALILLCALDVGFDVDVLVERTGLSREDVETRGERFRSNGIWVGADETHARWFDKHGGMALMCDCLVGEGWISRAERHDAVHTYAAIEDELEPAREPTAAELERRAFIEKLEALT